MSGTDEAEFSLSNSSSAEDSSAQDSSAHLWDDDSALGSFTAASSLTSLSPSMYEHVEENGRTYHAYKDGKYCLPNDEKEQDRLDLQHEIFRVLFDEKLALAPIDTIRLRNVLDIATGTGTWAIQFADDYPNAQVLGTDLSPIQPSYVPPNCSFMIDDAEDEWLFTDPFDYIHMRAVITCFSDHKQIFQSAYDALAPGGYLELQDYVFPISLAVDPIPEDSALHRWSQLIVEGAEAGGRKWTAAIHYARFLREIGFEDVQEHDFVINAGPWGKGDVKERKLSIWQLENWDKGLEPLTLRTLAKLGWSVEETRVLVAKARQELLSLEMKPFSRIKVVTGRKPGGKEVEKKKDAVDTNAATTAVTEPQG